MYYINELYEYKKARQLIIYKVTANFFRTIVNTNGV